MRMIVHREIRLILRCDDGDDGNGDMWPQLMPVEGATPEEVEGIAYITEWLQWGWYMGSLVSEEDLAKLGAFLKN